MKIPPRIAPLVEDGVVDEVVRQLRSGKEASIFVVRCGGEIRCAKVYKEAEQRSFRSRARYQEGRGVRNSRRARAMEKGSRYGRGEAEALWQSTEVDALYRLSDAGVRVPTPYQFMDGVLLMELVTDAEGRVAPRLDDLVPSAAQARRWHRQLVQEVVRMLCAGVIHGDLSEYNVLVDAGGPVIIDLPQAVDAAGNNSAGEMLARDVENLTTHFARHAPELAGSQFAAEIWRHYQRGTLTPHTELSGHCPREERPADLASVLREIEAAREEALGRMADGPGGEDPDWMASKRNTLAWHDSYGPDS